MKLARLVLAICAGHLMLASNLRSAPPSAEELERKAIKYRMESVRQGYVRMRVVDNPSPQPMERLYESAFDENRVRQVSRARLLGKDKWGEPRKIIVTPKLYVNDQEAPTDPTAVQIAPATDYKSLRENARILNLQALGMDINGIDMLHTAHVETLLNRADRTNPTVQEDHCGELETWRIDYELKRPEQKSTTHINLWIAPSQGYSVVSMKLRTNRNGEQSSWVVDSQLKQYPSGDVWFPFKVTKTMEVDGRVLIRQVSTIEEARFGGPIDEAAFTSSGLELKPGRQVVDSTSGTPWLKVWDGNKLSDSSVVKTAPPNPARHRRPRWQLLTLAGVLGLIAIYYFWRVIKHRRSTANPGT